MMIIGFNSFSDKIFHMIIKEIQVIVPICRTLIHVLNKPLIIYLPHHKKTNLYFVSLNNNTCYFYILLDEVPKLMMKLKFIFRHQVS